MATKGKAPGDLVDNREAAKFLGYEEATLRTMRVRERSPRYYKLGNGRVMYSRADLEAFKAKRDQVERIG